MQKHHKLQNMFLLCFSALALVLILIISLVVGTQYVDKEMENCKNTAYSYTKAAAELIDGDKISYYLETEQKDEYYYEILEFLNAFQSKASIRYFYVFVPFENDLVYIWDANLEEGACELGYHEKYMEGGKEATYAIYKQNPPEEIELVDDDTYGYIASAYSPVFDSDGEPVAVVGVDVYMPDLQKNMAEFLTVVIIAIVLVVLLAIWICFFFVKRKIVNPIKIISNASKSMVENLENEESMQVSVNTGNEIEELFSSFKEMYSDVRDYIDKLGTVTAEKERISAELDVAAHIQSSMLPCEFPAFPERKEFDIHASMTPAKEVGGDFYDFFMVDERHLAIVMADVSGKGVPAALFMVIAKTLIKDHTVPGCDLGEVFTKVNNLLCESNSEGLFVTAFEGVLDLVTGEFNFVNAGHEIPYICRAGKGFEAYKIKAGFVLAGMEDMKYTGGSIVLEEGDKIFQYTDGVTEAANGSDELYGRERLNVVLNENSTKSPCGIIDAVKADIDKFTCNAARFDDITMLCLEYKMRMVTKDDAVKKLCVKAVADNIPVVTDFAEKILDDNACEVKVKKQIAIAIDEIFGNIVQYAYKTDIGEVSIEFEIADQPKRAIITFTDNGIMYNPLTNADPDVTLSSDERQIGGLGIYMVKRMMDDVEYKYENNSNVLTISKNFQRS